MPEPSSIGERSAVPRVRPIPALGGRAATVVAVVILLVAVGVLLVRLPFAFDDLSRRASFGESRSPLERKTAAADALGIDNGFVFHALKLVPPYSTFAVLVPDTDAIAATYGIQPVTRNAVAPYMQDLLLPARMVDPSHAQYLLCYACNTKPYDPHMTRLWVGPGLVIGRLRR